LKNCAEFVLSLTAVLLVISLTILSPDGLAQTQMVLVTTGSTMRRRCTCYGETTTISRTLKRSFATSLWELAKVPKISFQEPEILAAVMRRFPKAVERGGVRGRGLPTVLVGIAVFYNVPGTRQASAFRGQCLRISTLEKQPRERPGDCQTES